MMQRPGYTLAELVVVLPLGLLLAALVIAGVVAQARLARQVGELASRAEAERIAASLLPEELHWAAPGDLAGAGPDSVRGRIFRGYGVPCAADPAAVRWSGLRAPDPAKDSVLVLSVKGEGAAALTAVARHDACAGYRLETPLPLEGAVVLVFETGTYYLSGGALRFRAGAEGRQPLTGEWFSDGRTSLRLDGAGTPRGADLALRPAGGRSAVELRQVSWVLPNAPGAR